MVRFLDFQETLTLACAAAGSFYVYAEDESPVFLERLRKNRSTLAVMFETTLSLDIWSLAIRYDIDVLLPVSLEELYRMIINASMPSLIYVCREVVRMKEAFEVSGYLKHSDLRSIPAPIRAAVSSGDIEKALDMYDQLEKKSEAAFAGSASDPYRRNSLIKFHEKGNAAVCTVVSGYPSAMLQYLLSESRNIDMVMILGLNRRVLREIKLLVERYGQIIWISPVDTVCSNMLGDKNVRKIVVRDIHELYVKLEAALPRNLRGQLFYPGRPEEWPFRFLPYIPEPEMRMCPGCIYRERGVEAAYCLKLGIDVYRSEEAAGHAAEKAAGIRQRLDIIGNSDEECIRSRELSYGVKRFLCDSCNACVKECGCPAISLDSFGGVIDPVICTGCGDCEKVCPKGAIYGYHTRQYM